MAFCQVTKSRQYSKVQGWSKSILVRFAEQGPERLIGVGTFSYSRCSCDSSCYMRERRARSSATKGGGFGSPFRLSAHQVEHGSPLLIRSICFASGHKLPIGPPAPPRLCRSPRSIYFFTLEASVSIFLMATNPPLLTPPPQPSPFHPAHVPDCHCIQWWHSLRGTALCLHWLLRTKGERECGRMRMSFFVFVFSFLFGLVGRASVSVCGRERGLDADGPSHHITKSDDGILRAAAAWPGCASCLNLRLGCAPFGLLLPLHRCTAAPP